MDITITLYTCKHCEERHEVKPHKLKPPYGDWTHIVVCPVLEKPILVSITLTEVIEVPDDEYDDNDHRRADLGKPT